MLSDEERKARKSVREKLRYAANRVAVLARMKAHRAAHPEKRRAWYLAHRSEVLSRLKARYDSDKKKAYNAAYFAANNERLSGKAKEYYATHKAERDAFARAYRETPHGRAVIEKYQKPYQKAWAVAHTIDKREASARRRARKRDTEVEKIDFIKLLRDANGVCAICCKPLDLFGIHFDHKVPLSLGGAHTNDNLQVTHARCNLVKGARVG